MNVPRPLLSFVVPVRNGVAHLPRLLPSITATATAAGASFEVIVGNNGSTDDTAQVASALGARVVDVPAGSASTVRNAVARTARGRWLAFIDVDHELDEGWCAAAIQQFDDATIAAVGAQYHAPRPGTWVQRTYDRFRRRANDTHDVEWLPSGNLIVRREMFEQLGGFDSTLETCEDVDFSQRLWHAGGRMVAVPRLRSTHFGDPRSLKALFMGELWRGRDNWRVTMSGPRNLRSIVSALMPLLMLVAGAAITVGLLTLAIGGAWLLFCGLLLGGALTLVRAVPLMAPGDSRESLGVIAAQAIAVSAVYNAARACALVMPVDHRLRRSA